MRFVIVGAGRVGLRTARSLVESGHDVVLIESEPEIANRARDEGFEVVEGDGTTEETLEAAGIERADAFGALTGDLNDNYIACLIAGQYDCRTVMRIDEDYREGIYRKYADEVDEIVFPERLGAIAAKNALVGGSIRAIADLEHDLQLVEFTITESAPMCGYSLSELELPANARLLALGKDGGTLRIPDADETLDANDRLVILVAFEKLDDVRNLIVGETGAKALGGA
ncbi:potassium channel family protein [Halovenus marina]|uniref:potassium channel family protein n=1 Tax=Halovenus marina TaxID=3396621 RepID=UPI003F54FD22